MVTAGGALSPLGRTDKPDWDTPGCSQAEYSLTSTVYVLHAGGEHVDSDREACLTMTAPSSSRRALLRGLPALVWLAGTARAQNGTSKPERPRISMAVNEGSALYQLPLTVAAQLRYFAAEGLDVEFHEFGGTGPIQQSLAKGASDLAVGGIENAIMLRQRGLDCLAFVLLGRAPQLVFGVSTRAVPAFRHLSQLRGARIGISAQEPATHWFAKLVLVRSGLVPAEVEFVALNSTVAAVAALREGEIAAIAHFDPLISLLEARGDIRVVTDTRLLRSTQELFGGPMPGGSLYAPAEFLQRNPRTVQGITNAVVKALKWLKTAGPSDIVRAMPEVSMHGDRAVFLGAFEKSREALSPDGVLTELGAQTAVRLVERYGALTPPVRVLAEAVYTNEFARKAKQRYQA